MYYFFYYFENKLKEELVHILTLLIDTIYKHRVTQTTN